MTTSSRLFVLPGTLALALLAAACGAGTTTQAGGEPTNEPVPAPAGTPTGGTSGATTGGIPVHPGNGNTVDNGNDTTGNGNTTGDTNTVDNGNTTGNANSQACSVDPVITASDEVFITKLSVVEDATRTVWTGSTTNSADGAWTMGRILHNVAGSQDANVFTQKWFALWQTNQSVNGQSVAARNSITNRVLANWPSAPTGGLDLTRAPVRLLAITNRIDLRQPAQGSAGELRFIYAVLDGSGNPLPFTIIFEFNMPTTAQRDVKAWATMWHALSAQSGDTAAYNAALQDITDLVTGINTQASHPTGSALFRIRTNENALNPSWELRQFEIQSNLALAEVAVTDTPMLSVNQTQTLADFVNQNTNAILDGTYSVPATFANASFLAGSILTLQISGGPTNPSFRASNNDPNGIGPTIAEWMSTEIVNNDARAIVSLNTCNGCHGGETNTPFLHVTARKAGQASSLSGFLTGESVQDPANPNTTRTYGDLQRRANEMVQVLCHGADTQNGTGLVARPNGI